VSNKKSYSTGEAAKQLGVSFRTLQRWITSSKISAVKMPNGRYQIEESEISRIAGSIEKELQELARIKEELVKIIERKEVAYLRELQVCMEYNHLHENTYEALDVLVEKGELKSETFQGNRWYFNGSLNWKDVEPVAIRKKELLDFYVNYPRDFRLRDTAYDDYSEHLVERALIHAGYVVVAKNAYYFNGNSYRQNVGAGRPRDVDFIAHVRTKDQYLGIQIKNRLEYPKVEDIHEFLDICGTLNLLPVLVTRISHPRVYSLINNVGGKIVIFMRYFLKPEFPREKFDGIVNDLGIPLGVYRRVPDFLVSKFEVLKYEL
jgi:excisionase family DNA binding protein